MGETVTLAGLRTQARQRSDMVKSKFISDSELTGFINASAKELYDILVKTNADYYTTLSTISVTGSTYSLPDNFYKLRGLDWSPDSGDSYLRVKRFNFLERERHGNRAERALQCPVTYRIVGNSIHFLPEDKAAGSYRLWMIPTLTALSADTDTFDGINGWEDYVIVDAAIKCLAKEESDTTALERQKARLFERITDMSNDREFDGPDQIANVTGSYEDFYGDF